VLASAFDWPFPTPCFFHVRADLPGPQGYALVFAFRCSHAGTFFQVYARPNDGIAPRLGVTVNKRIVRQATARNFCKRLAREVFRSYQDEFCGVDIVVRVRAPVFRTVAREARAEILSLMRRARRSCGDRAAAAPGANALN
jgi:ribonuclease P protein component